MSGIPINHGIARAALALLLLIALAVSLPAAALADGIAAQESFRIRTEDDPAAVSAFYQTLAENGTFSITIRDALGEEAEFKSDNGYLVKEYSSIITESYYNPADMTFTIKKVLDSPEYDMYLNFIKPGEKYYVVSVPLPDGYILETDSLVGGGTVMIAKVDEPSDSPDVSKYTLTLDGDTMYFSDSLDRYIVDESRYIFSVPYGTVFSFPGDVTIEIFGGPEKETVTLKAGELLSPAAGREYGVMRGGKLILFSMQTNESAYEMNIKSYESVGADIRPVSELLTEGANPPAEEPDLVASPTSSTVLVNGEPVAFDAYNIHDNNYFKLRDLAYVLSGTAKQFNVGWDGDNNAISLTSGQAYTVVGGEMQGKGAGDKTPAPTSSKIYLDGAEVTFTAYNIEDNNYFKLRDIGAALDFEIDWDGSTGTIVIDTGKGYTPD